MRYFVEHHTAFLRPLRRVAAGASVLGLVVACRPTGADTHVASSANTAAPVSGAPAATSPGHATLASSAAAPSTATHTPSNLATDTTQMCATAPLTEAVSHASAIAPQAKTDHLLVTDQEYGGWKMFHVYCYRCHGVDALGSTLAPNLRHSVSTQGTVTPAVFVTTVLYGRLDKGMPSWRTLLDCDNVTNLWAYLQARSSGRLAPGRPHTANSKG